MAASVHKTIKDLLTKTFPKGEDTLTYAELYVGFLCQLNHYEDSEAVTQQLKDAWKTITNVFAKTYAECEEKELGTAALKDALHSSEECRHLFPSQDELRDEACADWIAQAMPYDGEGIEPYNQFLRLWRMFADQGVKSPLLTLRVHAALHEVMNIDHKDTDEMSENLRLLLHPSTYLSMSTRAPKFQFAGTSLGGIACEGLPMFYLANQLSNLLGLLQRRNNWKYGQSLDFFPLVLELDLVWWTENWDVIIKMRVDEYPKEMQAQAMRSKEKYDDESDRRGGLPSLEADPMHSKNAYSLLASDEDDGSDVDTASNVD